MRAPRILDAPPDAGNKAADGTIGSVGVARYTRTAMMDDTYSELDHLQRTLPPREDPHEAGATLLAAAAIFFGILALLAVPFMLLEIPGVAWTPFKTGFIAIFLAVIALSIAGERSRLPRIGLVMATLGWLVGGILAVIFDRALW